MNMNYSLTDPTFSLTSGGTATLFSRWYLRAACRVTGRRREWQGPLRLPAQLIVCWVPYQESLGLPTHVEFVQAM